MRPLILGNGSLTVLIDRHAQIRDFFYPNVGQENHIDEEGYKIGVWVDGTLHWLDSAWDITLTENHGIGKINAKNPYLNLLLEIQCAVCADKNILIQRISVTNHEKREREVRLFISQHFRIEGNDIGNTAYYHPKEHAIIFYKGNRYFLISGVNKQQTFDDYAVGIAHFKDLEGTYRDAEDGILSKNPIQHGSVDATISFHILLQGDEKKTIYHFNVCGKKFQEVIEGKKYLLHKSPQKLMEETERYWKEWVKRAENKKFLFLPKEIHDLYVKSLKIIKMHSDSEYGGIIASLDSDILAFNKDTYSYVWPRDASFITRALDLATYHEVSEKFFTFAEKILTKEGYMLQKYNADHSLGSSWHPWSKHDTLRLPIQEDETALVICAFEKFIETSNKKTLLKHYYPTLIKPAADFMVKFRDKKTKLPEESYNLWEEKYGIHTFTVSTVYGALKSASRMAKSLKKSEWKKYEKNADEIKEAAVSHLCNLETKTCLKRIHKKENKYVPYEEVDASTMYSLMEFEIFPIDAPLLQNLIKEVEQKLSTPLGGITRYENDPYMKVPGYYPGNPWIITTMWLAQCYINSAKSAEEMKKAESLIFWASSRALQTGALSEQFNPYTGEPVSACPLAWSSAAFVETVLRFEEKMKKLNSSSA